MKMVLNFRLKLILRLLFVIWNIVFISADNQELKRDYWLKAGQSTLNNILLRKENLNVAKNVIVFVGDGMGLSTVTAARIYKGQLDKKPGEETLLTFESFPHSALVKIYNVNKQVPDSAGTATALFTGVKTNMAVLGFTAAVKEKDCNATSEKEVEVTSILQWAQAQGKSTGIVSTTRVTDATPGALYCHSASRRWESDDKIPSNCKPHYKYKDIARQLLEEVPGNKINVVLGGGRRHFLPANSIDKHGHSGQRTDKMNLAEAWLKRNSSTYVTNAEELQKVDFEKMDYLLGLFANNNMEYELDRDTTAKGQPSITEMTEAALKILQKNPKGYFLMVEGARIDHGHHENLAAKALGDTIAFDKAIESTLSKVDTSDTLVVVTADHSHVMTINGYAERGNPILGIAGTSDIDHLPYTTIMYTNGPSATNDTFAKRQQLVPKYKITKDKNYKQLSTVPYESETHSGEDVAVYATGPMAHLFQGVIEQNYIAHVLGYAACVGENRHHCDSGANSAQISFISIIALLTLCLVWNKLR